MIKKELDLWQKIEYSGIKPGLSRIRIFLASIGNPEKSLKIVQVAGTNGKGSVSRMLASALTGCGYKTGLFTSPHLKELSERIEIDGKKIKKNILYKLAADHIDRAKKYGLTFFEFITAVAFIYFKKEKTNIVVLETGLGGRFDATNVSKNSLLSVITDIDYDHTQFLGGKIEKIAFEKAGIIKTHCPVVSGAERNEALKVIKKQVKLKKSEWFQYKKDFKVNIINTDWKSRTQSINYSGINREINLNISLLGKHQAKNAAIALAALEILNNLGLDINFAKAKYIFRRINWPGRFDVRRVKIFGRNKTLIMDGAHNISGIKAFTQTLKESPWGKVKRPLIFAVMKDKFYKNMINSLSPYISRVFSVPVSSRCLSQEIMIQEWGKYMDINKIKISSSVQQALEETGNEKIVLACGSLYLIGEILKTNK